LNKKKKVFIGLFLIIILIIIGLSNIFYLNNDYNLQAIKTFKEKDIFKYVTNKGYSKTLEEIINTNYYDDKYLDEYLNITYQEDSKFLENINLLLNLGYNYNDINTFYNNLDYDIIVKITNLDYDSDLSNYIKLEYFKESNLQRYINFKKDENKFSFSQFWNYDIDLTYEDIVTYVNANLDYEYYTNTNLISNQEANSIDILVNKYNELDANFVPDDLTDISEEYARTGQKLKYEAAVAFEKMASDAKLENIKIYAGSTYRSYDYQNNLYNNYISSDGFASAETYSARAGFSEHQTGLAVDIMGGNWTYLNEDMLEYSWLSQNSYKYGFILRYPKGKEYITGYMFEDWHFRYLGVDVASFLHNSNLTYDEYVAREKNS